MPIWWRRRDANQHLKGIFVTDASGANVEQPIEPTFAADGSCGVITFAPSGSSPTYYAYYLPYHQSGGGAHLEFHWANCTSHGRECVLASPLAAQDGAAGCSSIAASAGATVTALESRPTPVGSDRIDFFNMSFCFIYTIFILQIQNMDMFCSVRVR